MKFSEIVEQACDLLQRTGRVSYRALKVEFDLSDDLLDVLKEELIEVRDLAVDKDGKILVWKGNAVTASTAGAAISSLQPATPQKTSVSSELHPSSLSRVHAS